MLDSRTQKLTVVLTNSWIYITDLPAPRDGAILAVLSLTEFLVIGGMDGAKYQNTVYKGTLSILIIG